jgi:predicted ATP-grasp superfamily ATP-dependent carboligase
VTAGRGAPGPPAIVLGQVNALSVIRSLGRRGVAVTYVGDYHERFVHSRHGTWLPLPAGGGPWVERALAFLTGPSCARLEGAVLLPCDDPSAELLARHGDALARRFRPILSSPPAQLCLLDKLCTYRAAVEAGVPTPRFWPVAGRAGLAAVEGELVYPLIVKPRASMAFQQAFGGLKHFGATGPAEAREAVGRAEDAGLDVLLVERIVAPDTALRSYYTWIDRDGAPRAHFTKRLMRRSPPGMGPATYHVTDWIPEIREPALRLLRHVGLRGVCQTEFIRDPRDGVSRLIECNVRFTQPNSLIAAAGIDLPWIAYRDAAGLAPEPVAGFRRGVRLWDPVRDVRAYRELRERGEITFARWLGSLRPAHLDTLSPDDPMPTLVPLGRAIRRRAAAWTGRGPARPGDPRPPR